MAAPHSHKSIIFNLFFLGLLLSSHSEAYYILTDPKISKFTSGEHTVNFELGQIKNYAPALQSIERFELKVSVRSTNKTADCMILKSLQVKCSMRTIKEIGASEIAMVNGVYKTDRTDKNVVIGRSDFDVEIDLVRNELNEMRKLM